jgi:hypothetical protein
MQVAIPLHSLDEELRTKGASRLFGDTVQRLLHLLSESFERNGVFDQLKTERLATSHCNSPIRQRISRLVPFVPFEEGRTAIRT